MRGRTPAQTMDTPYRLFTKVSNRDSKGRLKEGCQIFTDGLTGMHLNAKDLVLSNGVLQDIRDADLPNPEGWPYPYGTEH